MKKLIILFAVILTAFFTAKAQKSEVFVSSGKAIKGYDPVAFFKEAKAVKGNDSLSLDYKNATWLFSSSENLVAFKNNPAMYEPQYGGYCAYGTANGYKAPTQTDTWTIVDGKLYFNYNQKVKESWSKKQAFLITKANTNWPLIKDKP
ncbi:MAG: YHS domain protein [Sphingobacteriales bacterium]|nr:MAG: YHS domain protein [Sphingobacteriales bacterium]